MKGCSNNGMQVVKKTVKTRSQNIKIHLFYKYANTHALNENIAQNKFLGCEIYVDLNFLKIGTLSGSA